MSSIVHYLKDPLKYKLGWGVLLVFFGVFSMLSPFIDGLLCCTAVALLLIASGFTTLLTGIESKSRDKALVYFPIGGISIFGGLLFFYMPIEELVILTTIVVAYLAVDGVITIYSGFRRQPDTSWGWVTMSGVTALLLSWLMWSVESEAAMLSISFLAGLKLILSGWTLIMTSITHSICLLEQHIPVLPQEAKCQLEIKTI